MMAPVLVPKTTSKPSCSGLPSMASISLRTPSVRAILEATPSGHMTYLVTEHGKPFTAPGFGNKFRDWCNQAGLPHCSAHGIRKFDATAAAENGATAHQLMAMFGWDSIRQAEHYTRKASQQKLATGAMHLLTRDDGERIDDQSVPLPVGMSNCGHVEKWDTQPKLAQTIQRVSAKDFKSGAPRRTAGKSHHQRLSTWWDTETAPCFL
jgi:hypothetical protein